MRDTELLRNARFVFETVQLANRNIFSEYTHIFNENCQQLLFDVSFESFLKSLVSFSK